jgi:hypothetical protein
MRGESGPFAGLQLGEVLAYELVLPDSYQARLRPGTTLIERVYVLLEFGVQLSNPPYFQGADAHCWYIDLVTVTHDRDLITIWDQYIDVIVATDGRPYRLLDLDEFAQAITDGHLSVAEAVDGLIRWQRFLDRHLHNGRFPAAGWTDFPPAALAPLAGRPTPFARSDP